MVENADYDPKTGKRTWERTELVGITSIRPYGLTGNFIVKNNKGRWIISRTGLFKSSDLQLEMMDWIRKSNGEIFLERGDIIEFKMRKLNDEEKKRLFSGK